MLRNCTICGNTFESKHSTRNFCSEECRIKRDSKKLTYCIFCKSVILKKKGRKFCSEECKKAHLSNYRTEWRKNNKDKIHSYYENNKTPFPLPCKKCRVCDKEFKPKNSSQLNCSSECSRLYRKNRIKIWTSSENGSISCDKRRAKAKEKEKNNYLKNRAYFILSKGNRCEFCGIENLPMSCFDFHHKDPKEKEYNISELMSLVHSKEKLEKELEKCILLCKHCHSIHHHGDKKVGDVI